MIHRFGMLSKIVEGMLSHAWQVKIHSEQMYQALKSLGIDTQLVVYPGQSHGISKPSYQRDVLERYLAWYDKYLTPSTATTGK